MTYQGWTIVADYINETNSIANSATFTVSYNGSHNILPSNQSTIARGTVSEFDYKGHNLEIEFIKTYPNQKQIEIALVTSTNPT
jgi:hypothetical protein